MQTLGVEIIQVGKRPAPQEASIEVMHRPLHLALGARSIGTMGFGNKAVMTGKVQKERVPLGVAQLHLLHVVVKHRCGPSAEKGKGALVTVDQHRQLHRAGKAHEDHPRERQHHDEGVNGDELAAGISELPAVGPIRLRLLARRRLIPHRELGRRFMRSRQRGEVTPQNIDGAGEAHRADFLQQPHGRESARLVTLAHVVPKCIELGAPFGGFEPGSLLSAQHPPHGIAAVAREPGDLTYRVTFFM